jgi:alpha-1,6-mannosyltransferase
MTALLDRDRWRPGVRSSLSVGQVVRLGEAHRVDVRRAPLPPVDRPGARLALLDVTKWFGETSGGVRTYLTEKMRYVSAHRGLRHVLLIPGPFDAIAVGDGVRSYRLRGPRIPTQGAYRFLFATTSTRRIVAHERPDLIEVGSPVLVPWVTALAARRLGIPMVSFHHTSLRGAIQALGLPGAWPAGRRSLVGFYARRLDRLFRRTIVASEFAARDLAALGVSNTVRVPLGVDLERFNPGRKAQRDRTRRRFGLPADRPLALFVGRLAREKRLEVVLDAWVTVERACGGHLVIVGSGAEEAPLRACCAAQRVTWLPFQNDRELVAQLHAAADVFVAPGEVETFGLSALEALASGTPLVAPCAGAVAELVLASGAGVLYAPGSPGDCARAIRQVIDSDLAMLALRARSYAEREHEWTRVFDRLFNVYRSVVDETACLDS